MIDLVGLLGHVPAYGAYALVGTAVLAESVLLVGALVPTFTLLVTGGAMARYGHVNLAVLIAIAAMAVVVGDFLAHRTGRSLHRRPLSERLFRRVPTRLLRRAEALILRHGGPAVLASRFIPVVRTLTPHLAGMSDLSYRKMAPYSTVGALVWATAETTLGYMTAASLHQITTFGAPFLVAIAALTAAAVVGARWVTLRSRSRARVLPAWSRAYSCGSTFCERSAQAGRHRMQEDIDHSDRRRCDVSSVPRQRCTELSGLVDMQPQPIDQSGARSLRQPFRERDRDGSVEADVHDSAVGPR